MEVNGLGIITSKWQSQDSDLGLSASKAFCSALLTLHDKGPRFAHRGEQVSLPEKASYLWLSTPPLGESGRKSDHLQFPGRLIHCVQATAVPGRARIP